MAKKKTDNPLLYSVTDVDYMNSEALINGFIECLEVVDTTIRKQLDGLNDVMGIYMTDDLNQYKDRVQELHLMYTVLQSLSETIESDCSEKLSELKHSLGTDQHWD